MTLTQSDAIEHLQGMRKQRQAERERQRERKTHMIKNQLKTHSLVAWVFCENEHINFCLHSVCVCVFALCAVQSRFTRELVKIFNQLHESA